MLFSGNSNPHLAAEIASYLGTSVGKAFIGRFANGEIQVKIEENVRGQHVFLLQSTSTPVNDHIMELLIMIDALRRASARTITAVIPYFGYAKQEKKTSGREPISAKLVANLITVAGADRVITIDLHAAAIQGFFDIPLDNLMALPLLSDYFTKNRFKNNNTVVVSPDAGGVARARTFAERLGATLAIIFKRRPRPDISEVIEVVGEVKGKRALIIDDMISTGGTLIAAAEILQERGAVEVYACGTHPVFAPGAVEMVVHSQIKELVVTNTIPVSDQALKSEKIQVLSIAPLLGEAIRRINGNQSVSELFN
ncbi:MAG: ribose-phosphate pyrophosphokinase [Candidatus Eremiobacteraeota bacterium]|nr:ribose-phosphate pyrophosphokinase [Candidatus Eremiobacteraeota bacterium]MCL5055030.1 ribose-phosphate pyrophosphokinase [Bacillota bacterium]